ncbi:DNA-3-methyladenine glycosylase [Candidatus Jidaibacter acanthamoebae]|nr:DNA-3-methyladenine glycosylase [Candidatus Jidaibacter acanthamoeba]
MQKLDLKFFERPTLLVAEELIGKYFIFNDKKLIITETEAYIGRDDEACHAARGKTKRTEVMFGRAGCLYIYFIYGMYYCMNVVTEEEGSAAAVLIRGALDISKPEQKLLNGPGKLCKNLSIDKTYNTLDIVENDRIYFLGSDLKYEIQSTPRIGISKAKDKPWRFIANL